jgi:hypothetical protein
MPTYTVGATKTYATVNDALAVVPSNLAGTGIHRIVVDAATYDMGFGTITISKSNGSATDYIEIAAAPGSEHLGIPTAGVILKSSGFSACIWITTGYTRMTNINVWMASGSAPGISAQGGNERFENVICRAAGNNAFQSSTSFFYKCIAINTNSTPTTFGWSVGTYTAYNCGSYGFLVGFGTSGTCINCWSYAPTASGSACFGGGFGPLNPASQYNASTDATATGTGSLINKTVSDFGFVNAGAYNFHLSTSSVLRTAGLDLSGSFTTDIDLMPILTGDTWSMGPDLFNAPANFTPAALNLEVIYPVVPVSDPRKVVFSLDNGEGRVSNKVAAPVPRVTDTIRFRCPTASIGAVLANLDGKRATQFRLPTPGYTPFGRSSEDNWVRILTRSRPPREGQGLTQMVDVTFLFVATYP